MSGVLNAALALAAQGLPVFPCKADKAPACAGGFKAATIDPATVRALFADPAAKLIGVPTGAASGLDALDADPRHGSEAWLARHGRLIPPTLIHGTRSGGQHFLFRHRPGLRCSSGTGQPHRPGLDIKADGGYIIHWPSAGVPLWIGEEPAHWPDALLDQLQARPAKATEDRTLIDIAPPSAAAVVALLERMPNPMEADRDVYQRVMLAAAGCYQATGEEDIGDAAVAWAERWAGGSECDERAKWYEDWSTRTAPKAGWNTLLAVAHRLIPGFVDPTAGIEFDALPPASEPASRKLFTSRDFRLDLHQTYIIKRLIAPGNVCALLGQPGAGKSTLAPYLAYAIAQGRPVFGLRSRAGRTLIVAAEDLSGTQKRVGALGMRYGHTDDCAVVECGNLREPVSRAALAATVADFRPALILLDTVAAAFAGMEENSSQDMGQVVDLARKLAATGAAVILVHHPAKQGDGSPRGHSVLNGTLDMVLTLAPDDVTDADTIVRGQTPKNRNGSTAWTLAFRKEVLTLGTDSEGDPVTTTLPAELDETAKEAAKPIKLSPTEAVAMTTLCARGQIPESEWIDFCASLSAAAGQRDRIRSARNVHAKLLQKGAIQCLSGMIKPVAHGPNGSGVRSSQGIEFVAGIKLDQIGITTDRDGGVSGIMGSSP